MNMKKNLHQSLHTIFFKYLPLVCFMDIVIDSHKHYGKNISF